ncbi:hypothetical protein ACF0H5_009628 [Mactra antiquata]
MIFSWIVWLIFVPVLKVSKSCDNRCEWLPWDSWSTCCGGYGSQTRSRHLCCKISYTSEECLRDCDKQDSGHYDHRQCQNNECYNGGTYRNNHNGCDCLWNYYGTCCRTERRHIKQPSYYEDCTSGICNWTPWESWSSCPVSCGGGGTQQRERYLCCPEGYGYDYSYQSCLNKCGISSSISRFENRTCGETCLKGGTIKPEKYGCDCLDRSYGHCCKQTLPGCQPYPSDTIFVLDSSASQTVDQFKRQLDFVKTFIDNVNISHTEFQISVITFSWNAHLEINFNQSESRDALKALIDKIPFRPGVTNTHKGLRMAMDVARKSERRKGMVTFSYIIVLTDGMSSKRSETKLAAKELKSTDLSVIAIGIGNQVSQQELRDISSPGDSKNPSYVFSAGDFNALDTVLKQLVSVTCDECRRSYASDVQFLIHDEHLTSTEFQIVIDSITHIVRNMEYFGITNGTRLGVVRSSNEMQTVTTLQDSNTIEELLFMFQTLTMASDDKVCEKSDIDCGEERNITQTILKALDEIEEHKRENARQFLLILSSGRFVDIDIIRDEVSLIRKKYDVKIFVIGPGLDVDILGLMSLVSEANHVYLLRDSADLSNLDLLHTEFSYNVCERD